MPRSKFKSIGAHQPWKYNMNITRYYAVIFHLAWKIYSKVIEKMVIFSSAIFLSFWNPKTGKTGTSKNHNRTGKLQVICQRATIHIFIHFYFIYMTLVLHMAWSKGIMNALLDQPDLPTPVRFNDVFFHIIHQGCSAELLSTKDW